MDWIRQQKIKSDFAERSYTQWILAGALAFAERAFILIMVAVFLSDENRAFLTVPGAVCVVAGILFLAPVFGIFVFLTHRAAFAILKARRQLPQDIKGFKRLGRAVYIFWFPIVFFATWHGADLFYASYEGIKPLIFFWQKSGV